MTGLQADYHELSKLLRLSCLTIRLARAVREGNHAAEFSLDSYSLGSFVGRTVLLVGRDINRDRDEHRGLGRARGLGQRTQRDSDPSQGRQLECSDAGGLA